MRKVAHLAAAEMLHDLYGRYYPKINSIRFRHTVTNYRNGVVESYAPAREWEHLQKWVAAKFIRLDETIIFEIEEILKTDYRATNQLLDKIDNTNLKTISNEKLALLLLDIMTIPLGDIYKLNVVQIEYGLNRAIGTIMDSFETNQGDKNTLLALLISPNRPTAAQVEEANFCSIVQQGLISRVADATMDPRIDQELKRHYRKYRHLGCAYGELPLPIESYYGRYGSLYERSVENGASLLDLKQVAWNVRDLFQKSQIRLAYIDNPKLTALCNLLSNIGVFRDNNKAKLGETVIRRLDIFNEVSRRTGVDRKAFDGYLVSEMLDLLDAGVKVSDSVLLKRETEGVSFVRAEDMTTPSISISPSEVEPQASFGELSGVCASAGKVTGRAVIIQSKSDIGKMSNGDIMVAVGTDFDLLEIMGMAKGIITEEGGILSHASVVSREMRIPCIIGVLGATNIIKDGDSVFLNATDNMITINDKGNRDEEN